MGVAGLRKRRLVDFREILTTELEVIEFAEDCGDGRYILGDQDEAEFITTNIDRIVDQAWATYTLSQLGRKLRVSFDTETDKLFNVVWTNLLSGAAFVFSVVALLEPVFSWWKRRKAVACVEPVLDAAGVKPTKAGG